MRGITLPRVVGRVPLRRRLRQVHEQITQRIQRMREDLMICVVDLVGAAVRLDLRRARMSPLQRSATTSGWVSSASRSMMRTQPSRTEELWPAGRRPSRVKTANSLSAVCTLAALPAGSQKLAITGTASP